MQAIYMTGRQLCHPSNCWDLPPSRISHRHPTSMQPSAKSMQAIYMTGWAPSPKQPKAAARGSATVSFQDLEKAMQDQGALPEGSSEGSRGSGGRGQASPEGQATLAADDGARALAVLPACCFDMVAFMLSCHPLQLHLTRR